ncbi:MAG: cupin domain-containing protein [Gemmatimonadaceae bacterium]|nr:cupin domain-containing protein [Gemmatimonadaceae bacterium]
MIQRLDDVALSTGEPVALFPGTRRRTPWPQLDLIDLPGGAVHEAQPAPDVECGYLLLRGSAAVESAGADAPGVVEAPAALLCGVGTDHRLEAGAAGARLIAIGVSGAEPGRGRFLCEPFARDRLPWRDAIHGGGGRIATRHMWGPDDFASSWTFVDHAVLSRGSSLGRHYHEHMDEVFVVLSGAGDMTIGDRTTRIGPGHVTLQRPGEGHGLLNPCEEHLDFARVAVTGKGKAFTTIDLPTGDHP